MKFKILLLLLILSAGNISAGTTSPQSKKHQSWSADNGNGTYTNPLFYDEFTDPDIIRVGKDYYLAGTTMHCVPGIVILHSTDMVNWELCSYCFDRNIIPISPNLISKTERVCTVKEYGLPASVTITVNIMYSLISTVMDCMCISQTTSKVRGHTNA